MSDGHPLPDEIVLTRREAGEILFALDAASEIAPPDAAVRLQIEEAARILVEKFLPDLPDL